MKKILISVIVLAIIVVILTNLLRTKNTLKYKASAVKSESEINNNASLNIKPKTKFKNAESSILINSSTAVRKVNQSDEVTKSCSSFIQINNQISVKEYLIRINDLDKNVINQCAHYIKKHFSQFDVDKCITEIEQLKIDGIRNDVYKTCSRFINLKFWNRFRFEFANKSIQQLTKEELAGAYLGIWFDQSVPPASMMKMATKYASELLRRDPEDQYAINMLIRASMLDNENGNGYLETINWIRKAVKKDPSNINLLNHFVQRIAYTDGDTLESVHKIAEMIPELLVTQIILAENNFKNPDEKIKYYVNLAIKFPKNKDKYDQIINSINKKENYFFNVIDFSLDTVPEYLL